MAQAATSSPRENPGSEAAAMTRYEVNNLVLTTRPSEDPVMPKDVVITMDGRVGKTDMRGEASYDRRWGGDVEYDVGLNFVRADGKKLTKAQSQALVEALNIVLALEALKTAGWTGVHWSRDYKAAFGEPPADTWNEFRWRMLSMESALPSAGERDILNELGRGEDYIVEQDEVDQLKQRLYDKELDNLAQEFDVPSASIDAILTHKGW